MLAGLRAALDQYLAAGGQPARLARYQANAARLRDGLRRLGLRSYLTEDVQAPIIFTVHAPPLPGYRFAALYQAVRARGFILYPGKLTSCETFRIGCIGALDGAEIDQALAALAAALDELGYLPAAEVAA